MGFYRGNPLGRKKPKMRRGLEVGPIRSRLGCVVSYYDYHCDYYYYDYYYDYGYDYNRGRAWGRA